MRDGCATEPGAEDAELRIPRASTPLVSVVMVTYGAWSCTERALCSLVEHTPEPFELIVIDNASDDQTPQRLAELDGPLVVLNASNVGFGPACNQGAEHAAGRYLLLLNTDAMVHPGWLGFMLDTIERGDWVGAVVPRFLHEDGRLQEAGALIAQDGTVLTHGDGDEPERLRYRFRRIVDFGGAACMLLRREDFLSRGGFDPRFAPAYYEDVDLCFRLARDGRATVYDPRAVVTHVRHASGGLDRAIELSERNRAQFSHRWRADLRGRPATLRGATEAIQLAARDAPSLGRVLVADDATTDPAGGPAATLVARLAADWPGARIAWLTASLRQDDFAVEAWLDRGVELVDEPPERWLAGRSLAFDLVIVGAITPGLRSALAATQPQARFAALADHPTDPARLRGILADAGIAPSSVQGWAA